MTLSLIPRILRRPRLRKPGCVVCEDYGTVLASWVFADVFSCTCGADPGELVLHDADCDTVPCPFCPLAKMEKARG